MPSIERSLFIDENLNMKAFHSEKHRIPLSLMTINDVRQIETMLHEIDCFTVSQIPTISKNSIVEGHVHCAIKEIGSAINFVEEDESNCPEINDDQSMKIRLYFLMDQLKYLITEKFHRRYNILTQVFALKIHGLSPACYRLIQSSSCLILPHDAILYFEN